LEISGILSMSKLAGRAVEGVEIEPDSRRAVVVPLAPEGVVANTVKNLPGLAIVEPILHQARATVAKLLEGGRSFGLAEQFVELLDLDGNAHPIFQVLFQCFRLNSMGRWRRAHCSTFSMMVVLSRCPH
jgi:hypothetical protein